MKLNLALKPLFGILAATALSVQAQAASVTVNTTADTNVADSECSLREAITSVNTNTATGGCSPTGDGAIDTVELPAGNYVLSLTGDENNNASGDLDVLANLTLNGAGAETTIVSASGLETNGSPERVIQINPQFADLTVVLNDVTFRDGRLDDGGGILIQGGASEMSAGVGAAGGSITQVTLNGVNVVDNQGDDGGGILNDAAQLNINDSLIARNAAGEGETGGGIESFTLDGLSLQIRNSVIEGNSGVVGAGISSGGDLLIDSSTIADNVDACAAAGLLIESGNALIVNSTISGNRADTTCALTTGGGQSVAGGIGIDTESTVSIVNSTISQNFALEGGGGIAIIIPSAVPAPVAPLPAVKFGVVTVEGLHLFNVTITANETDGNGGGILAISEETMTGIAPNFLSMANSILADNLAATSPDCEADIFSEGYNLIGDATGCNGFTATGDLIGSAPNLGPLQDNGGPTFTHALNEGSPAIDSANPDGCLDDEGAVLDRDQRSETRPVNATGLATAICDRGAFEFQLPEPTPTPTPTATPGFLLNGTGCALVESGAAQAAPGMVGLLAGLGALAFRRLRRR